MRMTSYAKSFGEGEVALSGERAALCTFTFMGSVIGDAI
jgi:hypothetical protein